VCHILYLSFGELIGPTARCWGGHEGIAALCRCAGIVRGLRAYRASGCGLREGEGEREPGKTTGGRRLLSQSATAAA